MGRAAESKKRNRNNAGPRDDRDILCSLAFKMNVLVPCDLEIVEAPKKGSGTW